MVRWLLWLSLGLRALVATASAASTARRDPAATTGSFPAPYQGCSWVASLPGGSTDYGPCDAASVGSCAPGEGFVSNHSLACSPPAGVAVRPELLVFAPAARPQTTHCCSKPLRAGGSGRSGSISTISTLPTRFAMADGATTGTAAAATRLLPTKQWSTVRELHVRRGGGTAVRCCGTGSRTTTTDAGRQPLALAAPAGEQIAPDETVILLTSPLHH